MKNIYKYDIINCNLRSVRLAVKIIIHTRSIENDPVSAASACGRLVVDGNVVEKTEGGHKNVCYFY